MSYDKLFLAEVSIRALVVRLTKGGIRMRYMLLGYSDEQAWGEGEREQCYVESALLTRELSSSGHYVDAAPLHLVSAATSVRVREGKRMVTDGPFAETREQLGGFFMIEAENL